MPIEKPTTRIVAMKSTKTKGQYEASPSTNKNNPTANIRKTATHTQVSGRNTVPKIPRRTKTVPRVDIQHDVKKGDTP
jgi:hypothetical protein